MRFTCRNIWHWDNLFRHGCIPRHNIQRKMRKSYHWRKDEFKRKPSSIYIFTSYHPPNVKMDLTNGFGLEYPTNKLLWGSISDFKKRLMDRGWPHNFERKIAIRSKTHRRKAALLKQNNKKEKEILPFVTQYKPLVSIIKEALMKKCNHIQNQPLPCQILKEPLNPRTYTQNHSPTMFQEGW